MNGPPTNGAATSDDRAPGSLGYDRAPPFSATAEAAVLGGILIDHDAMSRVAPLLEAAAFHREAHRHLFRAMTRLYGRGRAIDPITLTEDLKVAGDLESAGGLEYIASLLEAVPTAANIEYHARIVNEKHLLRKLVDAAQEIVRDVYEPGEREVGEILDSSEQRVFGVSQERGETGFERIKNAIREAIDEAESMVNKPGRVPGLATGFADLDEMTTGLQGGDLAIVAGRPAMGKTSWVLNVAQSTAIEAGTTVGIFSLEMSREQLVRRLLCSEARVNAQSLRKGSLTPGEFQQLGVAASHLNAAPIYIDDSPTGTVLEMKAKSRRLKALYPELGLVIVDYMQLMSASGHRENRVQEVSEISRGLKALARELRIPVIALSQLSRAPEQRTDRRPQLSDLRESGAIEQDADLVMFLYRPEYYHGPTDKDGNSQEGHAELIVAKQRNGPTGTVNLYFHKSITRFESFSRASEPEGHAA